MMKMFALSSLVLYSLIARWDCRWLSILLEDFNLWLHVSWYNKALPVHLLSRKKFCSGHLVAASTWPVGSGRNHINMGIKFQNFAGRHKQHIFQKKIIQYEAQGLFDADCYSVYPFFGNTSEFEVAKTWMLSKIRIFQCFIYFWWVFVSINIFS